MWRSAVWCVQTLLTETMSSLTLARHRMLSTTVGHGEHLAFLPRGVVRCGVVRCGVVRCEWCGAVQCIQACVPIWFNLWISMELGCEREERNQGESEGVSGRPRRGRVAKWGIAVCHSNSESFPPRPPVPMDLLEAAAVQGGGLPSVTPIQSRFHLGHMCPWMLLPVGRRLPKHTPATPRAGRRLWAERAHGRGPDARERAAARHALVGDVV